MWQSPDPILGSYLDGSPNGGVYRGTNLALYSYVSNNPINAIDPNGKEVVWLGWNGKYNGIINSISKTGTYKTIFSRFISDQDNVFISPNSSQDYMGVAPISRISVKGYSSGYSINIGFNGFLNNGMLTADPTLIAKVLLHEGLHSRYHMARAEGNLSDYPTLHKHYSLQTSQPGYHGDHEAMAEGNISTFIKGMKEFDQANGTSHSEAWYGAMAWWGSLSSYTDDWGNLSPKLRNQYKAIQSNEFKYMGFLDAKANYAVNPSATNRARFINAGNQVDWGLYQQTRSP